MCIAGYAIHLLRSFKANYVFLTLVVLFGLVSGTTGLIHGTEQQYETYDRYFKTYENQSVGFRRNAMKYLKPNTVVLAYHDTYRYLIMPYFPVYGLLAYKSGEYFQLSASTAAAMLDDYNWVMAADRIETIDSCCDKYAINTAVVYGDRDLSMPVFRVISQNWQLLYGDSFFRIYRRGI